MKLLIPLTLLSLLPFLSGCPQLQSADPVYKAANRARLTAVEPLLNKEATAYPADAQKVSDLLTTWHYEVTAQSRTATTQP